MPGPASIGFHGARGLGVVSVSALYSHPSNSDKCQVPLSAGLWSARRLAGGLDLFFVGAYKKMIPASGHLLLRNTSRGESVRRPRSEFDLAFIRDLFFVGAYKKSVPIVASL